MNTLQNINRLILKTIIICHICKCLTNFLVIHFFAKIAKETGWQIFETAVFNPGHGQKGFRMSRSFQWPVEVFRSDSTDISKTLQHYLAWSLITISGLFTDNSLSVCICISQAKDTNFFIFSDRLKLVFILLLRYVYFLMLTLLLMDICSCKSAHQDIIMICL